MGSRKSEAKGTLAQKRTQKKLLHSSLSFRRRRSLIDDVKKKPLKTLAVIFNQTGNDSVKECLHQWQLLAVSSLNENEYTDGLGVAQLVVFSAALKQLIEVWYWMCFKNAAFANLHKCKNWEQPAVNFNDEGQTPENIINNFKEQFTWKYCRSELWFLLEAVMTYKGTEMVPYLTMLFTYEQLLCMAKAAYHYPLKGL